MSTDNDNDDFQHRAEPTMLVCDDIHLNSMVTTDCQNRNQITYHTWNSEFMPTAIKRKQ